MGKLSDQEFVSPSNVVAETGTPKAQDLGDLASALYPELRRLARRALRSERSGHTLQTTSLIHEAYLRLADSSLKLLSKAHFLALSARTMRRVLIDHARSNDRIKRGGVQLQVTLNENVAVVEGPCVDVLALDGVLRELERMDRRRASLLEMQLFGGLTYPEMAEATSTSEATVHRELRLARAWMQRQLQGPNVAVEP